MPQRPWRPLCSSLRLERPARAGRPRIRCSAGTASRRRGAASATSPCPAARHDDGCRRAHQATGASSLSATVRGRPRDPTGRVGRDDGRHLGQRRRGSCSRRSRVARSPSRRPSSSCGRTRLEFGAGSGCSGDWLFDAISPDGSTIYAVQYADLSTLQRSRHRHGDADASSRRRSSTSASPMRRCAARR